MTRSSVDLREMLVTYAWEAWSELGVAGWRARTFRACIDIDALVLLTGRLGDADARLRDESIGWCASNLTLVSRSRLAHLLRHDPAVPSWSAYAATLQAVTKQSWPGAGVPFACAGTRESRLPTQARASTLALRCRSLFGATVRGELVRILLMTPGEPALDARTFVTEAGFTKRSISDGLEHLRAAGLLEITTSGNSNQYRLVRRRELESLLGPLPAVSTSQRALCRVAWAVAHAVESSAGVSDRLRDIESARLERELGPDLVGLDTTRGANRDLSTLDALTALTVSALEATRVG